MDADVSRLSFDREEGENVRKSAIGGEEGSERN